jgi:hypothetical protein
LPPQLMSVFMDMTSCTIPWSSGQKASEAINQPLSKQQASRTSFRHIYKLLPEYTASHPSSPNNTAFSVNYGWWLSSWVIYLQELCNTQRFIWLHCLCIHSPVTFTKLLADLELDTSNRHKISFLIYVSSIQTLLYVCMYVCLSVCLSIYLPTYPSIYLSIALQHFC